MSAKNAVFIEMVIETTFKKILTSRYEKLGKFHIIYIYIVFKKNKVGETKTKETASRKTDAKRCQPCLAAKQPTQKIP